jgi:hypothetical protein
MKGFEQHFAGISVAVLLHAGLAALAVSGEKGCDASAASDAPSKKFRDAEVIEASLAFKEVKPESKQPQKQKKEKYQPEPERGVSRDEDRAPVVKEEKKETLRPTPDEVDINSILKKNRVQDDNLSSTGVLEVPREGAADGSEWGTERDARGDPYVGELRGRIYNAWKLPSLETGTGSVEGCVRLKEDGKIVDREVRKKSKNANLNRSVDIALKTAPNMEDAVPGHLKELLTVRGICFNFKLDDD